MSDYDPTLNPNNVIPAYDANQTIDEQVGSFDPDVSKPNTAEALKIPPALLDAITAYAKAVQIVRESERVLAKKQAEYLGLIRRQADLQRIKDAAADPVTAWCADYTEQLTGEVATLEVPGEVDPTIGGGINIKPGYFDGAEWDANYGQIQLGTALSPAGFAWNLTMLQPWLKWNPIWRYAIVASKNDEANTVNVTLNPIVSKARAYLSRQTDFNDPWQTSMIDVPVNYMSCGAAVFEPGDVVIVQFSVTSSGGLQFLEPTVIGFKEEPKMCDTLYFSNQDNETFSTGIGSSGELNWKEVAWISGNLRSVIHTQDGGLIIGYPLGPVSSGGVIFRLNQDNETVWTINVPFFTSVNYDSFNDRLVVDDSYGGNALFFNPATGASSGSVTLSGPRNTADNTIPYLLGVAVNPVNGSLAYALGNDGVMNTVHVNGSSSDLTSIFPSDETTVAWVKSVACSRGAIFFLVFDQVGRYHRIVQLNPAGSVVNTTIPPGIESAEKRSGGTISGGGVVPAIPPTPEP